MKKKFLLLPSLATILLIFVFMLIFKNVSYKQEEYNLNPDLSKKIVASETTPGFELNKVPFKEINELMWFSDLIVTGELVGEPKVKSYQDAMMKAKSQALSQNIGLTFTEYDFKIEDTILGDKKGTIKFVQAGRPGLDECETKIKPGKKYLILMQENKNDGSYHSVSFEEGIFEIDKKGKLLSFSKNITFAKYDTLSTKTLIDDIKKNSKDFKTQGKQ